MGTDTSRPLDAQDTERTHSAPMTYSPGRWAALEREVEKAVQESFKKHKALCVTERMRLALMAHHIKVGFLLRHRVSPALYDVDSARGVEGGELVCLSWGRHSVGAADTE